MTSVSSEERRLLLRRLHSASGVVPLGAFLILHLWVNAFATQGQLRYEAVLRRVDRVPGLVVFEVLLIWLPLAFHAGYGLGLARPNAPPVPPRPRDPEWARPLERITGLVTLAFLVFHAGTLRLRTLSGALAPSDLYAALTESLSTTNRFGIPVAAIVYLVGLAGACYHLASGLMGFCATFGLVQTDTRYRVARAASVTLGLSLFLLGTRTIVYFATGAVFAF